MSTDITKRQSTDVSISRPDFVNDGLIGVDNIKQYIVPPRLKIVQPQSKAPFSELFDKGDVVIVPQRTLLAPVIKTDKGKSSDRGTPFHICPIFFFPEWCVWNPIQMQGSLPTIRERTFDPQSRIAVKARNRDSWFEKCPENPEYNIRYCEHLNFIVSILGDGPMKNVPCVISFARGGYRAGSALLSLINIRQASIFAGQYELCATFRTNDKGEWYGFEPSNPSQSSGVSPWVKDVAEYEKYKAMHSEYAEAHSNAQIIVEHDDLEDELAETEGATPPY